MKISDIIAIVIILLIVGGAVAYIVKAKRSGRRCIGCPDSKTCSGNCGCCGGSCGSGAKEDGEPHT
ncbi:MAG: FeoB-associated Cys-rich membrane protein [Clostridia bacterium]|nr:FeoB-associated Cys-rich membrane protein [Clostridia bacterium]